MPFKASIIRVVISSVVFVIIYDVGKSRATTRTLRTWSSRLRCSQSSASRRDRRSTCSLAECRQRGSPTANGTVQGDAGLPLIRSLRSRQRFADRARLRKREGQPWHGLRLAPLWKRGGRHDKHRMELSSSFWMVRIMPVRLGFAKDAYRTKVGVLPPGSLEAYPKRTRVMLNVVQLVRTIGSPSSKIFIGIASSSIFQYLQTRPIELGSLPNHRRKE